MSYIYKKPRDTAWFKTTLRNNLTDFFLHGKIKTTKARAKEIQKHAEKIITLAKKETLASTRQISKLIVNKKYDDKNNVLYHITNTLSKKYKNRNGGYTQVLQIENRKGDNSEMAILKLI